MTTVEFRENHKYPDSGACTKCLGIIKLELLEAHQNHLSTRCLHHSSLDSDLLFARGITKGLRMEFLQIRSGPYVPSHGIIRTEEIHPTPKCLSAQMIIEWRHMTMPLFLVSGRSGNSLSIIVLSGAALNRLLRTRYPEVYFTCTAFDEESIRFLRKGPYRVRAYD